MDLDDRYKLLMTRRVPRVDVVEGRAYVIHARNGGIGVAVVEDGQVGYELHREKFGEHDLFIEYDWDCGPPFGTAIPLKMIFAKPPTDADERLAWLVEREAEHSAEIDAAWDIVLGPRSKR